MMKLEEMKKYVAMDNTFVASEAEEIKNFVDTCKGLGVEVNEPVDEVEFNRLKDIIVAMYEDEMEDEEMNDTAATVEVVEVTLADKAKEFAEASKEKIEAGFKFVVENIVDAKEIVEDMADMSSEELEDYLEDNAKDIFDNLMSKIKSYRNDMKDGAEIFPNLKATYEKCDNIIGTIQEVLDDDSKKGWGKFKEIVKSLIIWLVKMFLKVAAIVLKLVFTAIVGAIKVGCTTFTTGMKVAKVVDKELIKPTIKVGKNVWSTFEEKRKEKKARMDAARDILFEDDLEDNEEFLDDEDVVAEQ